MTTSAGTMTQAPAAPAVQTRVRWGFAEIFVISQTALPALLFLPGTQAIRLPVRISPFAISLAAFAWWQLGAAGHVRPSRVQSWAGAILILLMLMLFHPSTPSVLGGVAQIGLYFAVMAPVFWAPSFVRTPEQFARILWLLLLCSGINSVVGVLQVYDPARWLPSEFSNLVLRSPMGMGPVTYRGPGGQLIVRPPGLFDTPGAVAGPAMFATLLGLVFAASAIPLWKRVLSLVFASAGLAAIYLTQVRISLVIEVLVIGVYAATIARQGRLGRSTQFVLLAAGILIGSFVLALALGGSSIQERVLTLLADDPLSVYHSARGSEFDLTFKELLFRYPFGAGLGRWGMSAMYFSSFNLLTPSIWAEIQFTGWLLDGGALMIVLYGGALIVTALTEWRVATGATYPRLAACGAVTLAANIGAAALIFTFTPFVTQIGVQYWFLAGALHGVSIRYGMDGA